MRPRLALLFLVLASVLVSCAGGESKPEEERPPGTVAQPLVDTDNDGLDDDYEIATFGNLAQTGAGDFDADGMTNGEEYAYGFNPTVTDALDDADGDRYPNIYEVRHSSNPNDAASLPTPSIVVNPAGGGTHTTISAAMSTANASTDPYPIIGLAAATFTGPSNTNINASLSSASRRPLLIGLEGAAKTIIDGEGSRYGLNVYNPVVISSITFRRTINAMYVSASAADATFVDLLVKDNAATSYAGGLHVSSAARVSITGCTFLNNTSTVTSYGNQLFLNGSGSVTIANSVVWGQAAGPTLIKSSGSSLSSSYSLVKDQALSGTGNLSGTTDPKLGADGHLLADSPLRSAGGSVASSRLDMDGELRPISGRDIGVDQFLDQDNDSLPDEWELAQTGNLTTLTGPSQDADSDGLTNAQEYTSGTSPTTADTDGDGLSDSQELGTYSTDPLKPDTDGDDMPDGWEATHALNPLVSNGLDDLDGDRFPNAFEYAYSTDPNDASSKPTPTIVVDGAGGGTHTNVSAAVAAMQAQTDPYPIIGIRAGVYAGSTNAGVQVTPTSSTRKVLLIGLDGAAKTVIDGGGTSYGWFVYNSAVLSSLTIRRTRRALLGNAPTGEIRLIDLLVKDNVSDSAGVGGVQLSSVAKATISGCTFQNNVGATANQFGNQLLLGGTGALTIANTAVWGQATGPMLVTTSSFPITASHSLVAGLTLAGTANLPGTSDPKLRSDGHLLWDSPLRGAGGPVSSSRIDMDGELRPTASPDIGVDQFVDSENDGLADFWEMERAGDLTTLTSRSQDADGDGLSNELEYANDTLPTVADSDGDGLSDGDELNVDGTNPLSADSDGDGMPDAFEIVHGLHATTADALDDPDGDRYPSIFEFAHGSDPSNRASIPTPAIVVNPAGGGTHTTVSAAVSAANASPDSYPIIGLAAGTYVGAPNLNITVSPASVTKKFLIIGLEGAAKTIIDGGDTSYGWNIYGSTVLASLTFQHTARALYAAASSSELGFVDLLVKDNIGAVSFVGGLQLASALKASIIGCTFIDNRNYVYGSSYGDQLNLSRVPVTIANTVIWGDSPGPMVVSDNSFVTLSVTSSLVKGQTFAGTGNLVGTTDPHFRKDSRIKSDSPLRGAGASLPTSAFDLDLELRPSAAMDLGVGQWTDLDADGLPDGYEKAKYGSITTVSGAADADDDGLTNAQEYDRDTDPLVADTDGDGLEDGYEVAHGLNPLVSDVDDLALDSNHDGLIDSVGFQLGFSPLVLDSDGDSVSNVDEAAMCTNPLRSDSDGDGVPDSADAFPLDPLLSTLPSNPTDVTPPMITLTAPWFAVAQ